MKTSSVESRRQTEEPGGLQPVPNTGHEAPEGAADGGAEPIALCFADFELRLDSGELWKAGAAIKLQPRPARVLEMLARRAGEVVSREELRSAVWGEETYVDFDLALNFCIRRIRGALGDSAEEPRFVATIPRRGYRFLAPVEAVRHAAHLPLAPEAPPAPAAAEPPPDLRRRSRLRYLAAAGIGFLALALSPAETPPSAHRYPPAAIKAYLHGRDLEDHGATTDAIGAYQEATILAPDFAPAYASLGEELLNLQRPASDGLSAIESVVHRALVLDPALPLAHLDLATSRFLYRYDWKGAEAEFRTTLRLEPGNADARFSYAVFLAARGRRDEALREAEKARWLAPSAVPDRSDYAWFYYLLRRFDDATEQARRTLEMPASTQPLPAKTFADFWADHVILLTALARGDRAAALAAAQDVEQRSGHLPLARLDEFWQRQERRRYQFQTPFLWYEPLVEIERKEPDRAIDLLLRQCRDRSSLMIPFLQVDPLYDSLRRQPRFAEVLRCAHLEDPESVAAALPPGAEAAAPGPALQADLGEPPLRR